MMKLKLYNTESQKKEEVTSTEGNTIRLYTCGPTVYHYAHIGNFRTYVFEDILRKTLKHFGFKVIQVMNLTDVEDKTIKGAIENNLSLDEYTKPFKQAFFEDLDALGIERAEHYPEATAYVNEMIKIIQKLMDEGIAYVGKDKSIYFSISKFPKYGRLSHLKLDELKKGASGRLDDEYEKDDASDFVLWKHYDPKRDGSVVWESPFGKGRPGWHIECSAMALSLLGNTIDIHCGGVDNIFPHHENEIAQSECFTHKPFVRFWCHAKHLVVDNKKMSKSLGNYYTLKDLLEKGYTGREIRFLLLQTHYRSKLNFTLIGLQAARQALRRISDFTDRLKEINNAGPFNKAIGVLIQRYEEVFFQALADDLNTPSALAALFDFIREINGLCDKDEVNQKDIEVIEGLLQKMDAVLGIIFSKKSAKIPQEILDEVEERNKARKDKQWQKADEIRDSLYQKGYIIEDKPDRTIVKKRG